MITDDIFKDENNAKVDFLEAPSSVPSETGTFRMGDKQQEILGGGSKPTTEQRQRIKENSTQDILMAAHQKILRYGTSAYETEIGKFREAPTIDRLTFNGQVVELVGTQHDTNSESPQMRALEGRFQDYLYLTTSQPEKRVLMFEGAAVNAKTYEERVQKCGELLSQVFEQQNVTSAKDAARLFGEMGAIVFQAQQEGVPIVSPEPSNADIAEQLKKEGVADIALTAYFAARQIAAYEHRGQLKEQHQFTPDEVFDALATECGETGWNKENALRVRLLLEETPPEGREQVRREFIQQILPQLNAEMQKAVGFNLVDPDYRWGFDARDMQSATYQRLFNPSSEQSILNSISRRVNEYRDDFIVDTIHEAVSEKGESPLIAFGLGHAVTIKPALASLYTEIGSLPSQAQLEEDADAHLREAQAKIKGIPGARAEKFYTDVKTGYKGEEILRVPGVNTFVPDEHAEKQQEVTSPVTPVKKAA